jgi:hypothetical protein
MKSLLLAGAALALIAGANLPPAMAQANPLPRWDTSQAMPQSVEQGAADAVTPSPRYEYQYHYGESPRHPRWELQLVPVK